MSAPRAATGTEEQAAGRRRHSAASIDRLAVYAAPTVGDVPRLINAMDRFASEHSSFESSTVGNLVQGEMAAAADVNLAALAPLRHKIYTFDVALKWGFFMSNIVPRILAEDGGEAAAALGGFDLLRYNAELATIYDLAVEAGVWEYCEEEEEDGEDGEEAAE